MPIKSLSSVLVLAAASAVHALPAFPGAEGPGADATGGRGRQVVHVTNLNDDGEGSFREALRSGDRIIVFDVGGVIPLKTPLKSQASNVTIAGETAPGDGITLRNANLKMTGANVILRNLKFRPGKTLDKPGIATNDGFTNYLQNSIIDHVSVSWADDEGLSSSDFVNNCTVQYAIIAEGLNYKGHGYGSIITSENSDALISYHHCLYAHLKSRLPRIGAEKGTGAILNWSNNVIYNWSGKAGYSGFDIDTKKAQPCRTSFLGNYYIFGPDNKPNDVTFHGANPETGVWTDDKLPNIVDRNKDGKLNGDSVTWEVVAESFTKSSEPYKVESGYVQPAAEAFEQVVNTAGAFWWKRDAVDSRIVQTVRDQKGKIIKEIDDIGGRAELPLAARTADFDVDRDGMADEWERAVGLDPTKPDHNGDLDKDGYTNIEEYFHSIASFPAPKPLAFRKSAGRFEDAANWDLSWQPGRYDVANLPAQSRVTNEFVSVARVLRIEAGAELTNSGTLHVAEAVEIAGTLKQTGKLEAGAIQLLPTATLELPETAAPDSAVIANSLKLGGKLVVTGSPNARKIAVAETITGTFAEVPAGFTIEVVSVPNSGHGKKLEVHLRPAN